MFIAACSQKRPKPCKGGICKPLIPKLSRKIAKLTPIVRFPNRTGTEKKTISHLILFYDKHFTGSSEITRSQRIEIETTGNQFIMFVSAIPIRGTAFALIHTPLLLSKG